MKDEEMRIAIAEACGWKRRQLGGCYVYYTDDPNNFRGALPNFLNDLNAMHEAEKVLKLLGGLVFYDYTTNLLTLCESAGNHTYCATARQRAEAFLRTIGKWEESPGKEKA